MALRTTQDRRIVGAYNSKASGINKFSIKGSQAHSLMQRSKSGTDEVKVVSLPKLKFLENKDEE